MQIDNINSKNGQVL